MTGCSATECNHKSVCWRFNNPTPKNGRIDMSWMLYDGKCLVFVPLDVEHHFNDAVSSEPEA